MSSAAELLPELASSMAAVAEGPLLEEDPASAAPPLPPSAVPLLVVVSVP